MIVYVLPGKDGLKLWTGDKPIEYPFREAFQRLTALESQGYRVVYENLNR
ncbi:MAG TPA: hypothetical protein V6D19_00205 [Stenomitos sp.]